MEALQIIIRFIAPTDILWIFPTMLFLSSEIVMCHSYSSLILVLFDDICFEF